jgi:hypothetical protein
LGLLPSGLLSSLATEAGIKQHGNMRADRCWRCTGVDTLYVHLMAVNEVGRCLYESSGFELEQEETSNQAHYRGHCLDGVEGRGRTILMRRTL